MYGHDLRAVPEDLDRWRAQGRLDLVLRVGEGGVLWCAPASGDRLDDCPFLVRAPGGTAGCRIHPTKPAVCRDYPTRAHRYRCVRGLRFDEGVVPRGGGGDYGNERTTPCRANLRRQDAGGDTLQAAASGEPAALPDARRFGLRCAPRQSQCLEARQPIRRGN